MSYTLQRYGMGKSSFQLMLDGEPVGFIRKRPKPGAIGKWEWYGQADGQEVQGPYPSKDVAAYKTIEAIEA